MLLLFSVANILRTKRKRGVMRVPLSVVIKTYGLAIDREVFFRISPSSDKAADSV